MELKFGVAVAVSVLNTAVAEGVGVEEAVALAL